MKVRIVCAGMVAAALGLAAASDLPELRRSPLVGNLSEPIALDVSPDGRAWIAERRGAIKVWDPNSNGVQEVGRLPVFTGPEDGILGMVLDPGFATNRWIYLYHSTPGLLENRLSRFTVSDAGLDPASQKTLLAVSTRIPKPNHSGGGLDFDGHGNLYLGVGDYTIVGDSDGYAPLDERPGRAFHDSQRTAANTADLHGKILRIHPEPDGTASIPRGNLFPPGTPRTRPEIFVMGVRNPFRLCADRATDRLFWGDVGPDALAADPGRGPAGFDEFNVTRTAGNYGWPYFSADNRPYVAFDFATRKSGTAYDPNRPQNHSPNNTGLADLPPARPALLWYPPGFSTRWPALGSGARSAMAGPVCRPNPSAPRRWPARYEGSVVLWDWERGHIWAAWLDASDHIERLETIAPADRFLRPIAARFATDGSLWVLEWGSKWSDNRDAALVRVSPEP
jgi:cytochrome c